MNNSKEIRRGATVRTKDETIDLNDFTQTTMIKRIEKAEERIKYLEDNFKVIRMQIGKLKKRKEQ